MKKKNFLEFKNNMNTIITQKEKTILDLISDYIKSQYNFNKHEFNFAKNIIFKTLNNIKEEKLIKNLLYLNKNSKIGKFALSYSDNLIKYVKNKDSENLKKLLEKPKTKEFDSNEYLTGDLLERKNKEFETQMLTLNLFYDQTLHENKTDIVKCEKDVCFLETNCKNPILEPNSNFIWCPNHESNANSAHCFKLPDLLILMLTTNINPYTNEEFSKNIKKSTLKKYRYECALIKKYLEN